MSAKVIIVCDNPDCGREISDEVPYGSLSEERYFINKSGTGLCTPLVDLCWEHKNNDPYAVWDLIKNRGK